MLQAVGPEQDDSPSSAYSVGSSSSDAGGSGGNSGRGGAGGGRGGGGNDDVRRAHVGGMLLTEMVCALLAKLLNGAMAALVLNGKRISTNDPLPNGTSNGTNNGTSTGIRSGTVGAMTECTSTSTKTTDSKGSRNVESSLGSRGRFERRMRVSHVVEREAEDEVTRLGEEEGRGESTLCAVVFCVLYAVRCVLYAVCCVLYALCAVCCVLCAVVFCVLYAVRCVLCAICTVCCALCAVR